MRQLIAASLLLLFVSVLSAQESAPAVEPQEPDIVLPEVILRIEDFSVEDVEAGLAAFGHFQSHAKGVVGYMSKF